MSSMAFRGLILLVAVSCACAFSISGVGLRSPLQRQCAISTPGRKIISLGQGRLTTSVLGISMQAGQKHPMHDAIDKVVKENKIVLFMKGNKDFPQCGFSNTAVQVLKSCKANFETINVLENENIRQGIKMYSNWPTIPQLFIDGEFIGGADIMIEMYQNGEMAELVEKAMAE